MTLKSPALTFAAALVATVLFSVRALAADPIAERLYNDGRRAAEAKDWDRACQLFQESQNREPAPGTLLNLADCEENRGKLLAAAAQFHMASRLFQPGDARIQYATERAAQVQQRVARLRIVLRGEGSVECDGAPVDQASLDTFVPMDPGEHVLVVRSAGRADTRSTILLGEGEAREVELSSTPEAPAGTTMPVSASPSAPSAPPPPRVEVAPPAGRDEPSRLPAYAAFGIGAVGLGAGIATGLLALGAAGEVVDHCPNRQCATPAKMSAANDAAARARGMSLASTIGFGVGLGGAAAGVLLLLLPSKGPALAPAVGAGSVGMTMGGTL